MVYSAAFTFTGAFRRCYIPRTLHEHTRFHYCRKWP
ncbi:hypothetical protein [Enterobacter sp. SA187]